MMRDPGIRTLNDPSFGKKMEAFGNDLVPVHLRSSRCPSALNASPRVIDNLQLDPTQKLVHPCLKLALIAAIGPDHLETREVPNQGSEQDRRPVAISDVSGKYFHPDEQPLRVHQQMPLPAVNFFSPRRSRAHHHAQSWF